MNNKDRTLQELSGNDMHNRSQYQKQHHQQRALQEDDLFMPHGQKSHHHMQSVQESNGFHSTMIQPQMQKMSSHNYNTRQHAQQPNHQHFSSVQYPVNLQQKNGIQRKPSKQLLQNNANNNLQMTQNIGGSGFASSRHLGGQNSQQRYRNTRNGISKNTSQQSQNNGGGQSQVIQNSGSQSNLFAQKSHRSSRNQSREGNSLNNMNQGAPSKYQKQRTSTLSGQGQYLFKNNKPTQRNANSNMNSNSKNPKTMRTMSSKSGRMNGNENAPIDNHRRFQLENGGDIQIRAVKVPNKSSNYQVSASNIGAQINKIQISNIDLMQGNCMNGMSHPSRMLCRKAHSEFQRQNINVRHDLSEDIDNYLRSYQHEFDIKDCLQRHKITPTLRARMIDWMIEVLTNFKCDDQTFFLAVSLQDRFTAGVDKILEVGDLHVLGVTSMFVASKFEDIYPLKMKTVHEKIAHSKLEIEKIKSLELEIMKIIKYKIHAPTVLDFLKVYLLEALDIHIQSKTITKKKEEEALACNQTLSGQDESMTDVNGNADKDVENEMKVQHYLIEKMTVYLAKMSMHDVDLCTKPPSLLAVGAIYVALKICEQLKRKDLINSTVVTKLIQVSHMGEDEILEVSQKVLYLAQNFDQEFPSLENLKKTHFGVITQLLCDEKYQNGPTDLS